MCKQTSRCFDRTQFLCYLTLLHVMQCMSCIYIYLKCEKRSLYFTKTWRMREKDRVYTYAIRNAMKTHLKMLTKSTKLAQRIFEMCTIDSFVCTNY